MTRILLVEDDARMGNLLCRFLLGHGYQVQWERDGPRGCQAILDKKPELVILDLMLPGMDGLEICKQIRPGYGGPILMLTANDNDLNHINALDLGIDDYLLKPFRAKILAARIRALLRRAPQSRAVIEDLSEASTITIGTLHLSLAQREANWENHRLDLTESEFELLWLLADQVGQVVSREAIYAALFGTTYQDYDRAIDMRISSLRKKLGDDRPPYQLIKTIRGKGYQLSVPQND